MGGLRLNSPSPQRSGQPGDEIRGPKAERPADRAGSDRCVPASPHGLGTRNRHRVGDRGDLRAGELARLAGVPGRIANKSRVKA